MGFIMRLLNLKVGLLCTVMLFTSSVSAAFINSINGLTILDKTYNLTFHDTFQSAGSPIFSTDFTSAAATELVSYFINNPINYLPSNVFGCDDLNLCLIVIASTHNSIKTSASGYAASIEVDGPFGFTGSRVWSGGFITDYSRSAFVTFNKIPEPPVLILMIVGIIGLLCFTRINNEASPLK